jgi:hypothetical protein
MLTAALDTQGNHSWPMILVNGEGASNKQEVYPGPPTLARLCRKLAEVLPPAGNTESVTELG